jgi:hypothetical protein
MGFAGQQPLEDALDTLGAVLEARDLQYSLVAVGGGSLLLLGLLQRPTKDLDIVALVGKAGYEKPDPLPEPFVRAVRETARTLGLADDWVNAGPASLLDFGLPDGFETRLQARRFGGLDLRLLGRSDQVALKLYAAVDQGPSSKHAADLRQLAASRSELLAGARWARQHDPSPGFRASLVQALAAFDVRGDDDDL